MQKRCAWLGTSLAAVMMVLALAAPVQAGYGSGGNCSIQYCTEIESDTSSLLKTTHTYIPATGNGVAYSAKTSAPFRTKSPYLTGSWTAYNGTPYEAFDTLKRNCLIRPVL